MQDINWDTPEQFRDWLKSKTQDEVVGYSAGTRLNPIAMWLNQEFRSRLTPFNASAARVDRYIRIEHYLSETENHKLPLWASIFLDKINQTRDVTDVSAITAIGVLSRVDQIISEGETTVRAMLGNGLAVGDLAWDNHYLMVVKIEDILDTKILISGYPPLEADSYWTTEETLANFDELRAIYKTQLYRQERMVEAIIIMLRNSQENE